jgi:hypothetical protein
VESGTFAELLSDEVEGPKVFRDLYGIQAAQYAVESPALPTQKRRLPADQNTSSAPTGDAAHGRSHGG